MSRFSGKCDFCDEISFLGINAILNSAIYVGDQRLQLSCLADCVPYYPHIVTMSYWDTDGARRFIRLSEKSWVDMEEERYGKMRIHDLYRAELQKEIERSKSSEFH